LGLTEEFVGVALARTTPSGTRTLLEAQDFSGFADSHNRLPEPRVNPFSPPQERPHQGLGNRTRDSPEEPEILPFPKNGKVRHCSKEVGFALKVSVGFALLSSAFP
jgi:hypothetical protein